MQEFITGYQFSPADNHFIGEYTFPNNLDKDAIHLPPHTTLTPPPVAPVGFWAYWNPVTSSWSIAEDNDLNTSTFPDIPFEDLLPEFIEDMRRIGLYDRLIAFYEAKQTNGN